MPGFLIPARNSRHRTACFALYRALLKQAPNVPLPDNLAQAWGPGNPIKHLIRRAFRRNITDTSPRLVFPALKAGYQMLAVLKASSPASLPWARNLNYESIIQYLRARLRERNHTLEAKALHPPNSRNPPKIDSAPRKETVPLLVNVTPEPTPENPFPAPVYATPHRPRPASELGGSGRRRVPNLDMASDIPFLRIKKPQPALLSRVLTQKIKKRVERYDALGAFWDDSLPEAALEDEWEKSVGRMMKEHRTPPSSNDEWAIIRQGWSTRSSNRGDPENPDMRAIFDDFSSGNTFENNLKRHGIDHLHTKLNEERLHMVARADAMRKLIEEETALAEQEKVQRIRDKRAMQRQRKLARLEGGIGDKTEEPQSEGWEKLVAASEPAKKKEPESRPVQYLE